MGVANTIMALSLGVEVMHTTVLGIGERSGNAPMEEIVMALKTMYGVDVGIDTTKLTPLANLVQRLTGVLVPTNKAIVGSGLYQIESGIIASWFKNCGEKNATELFPIRWSAVGQPPAEVVMGKGSGIDSINMWLKDVGMQVSEEDAMKVLQAVKLHSLTNKKMLSHAEFRDVARATWGRNQQAAE
jgi:isopropylmalate/homocitrate/citramalate synthase